MKQNLKLGILFLTAVFSAACEKTEIPYAVKPAGQVAITKDGSAIDASRIYEVFRNENISFNFTYEGVSRVVADVPEGWGCKVKMAGGEGTVTITGPAYGNHAADNPAQIKLLTYDGTGNAPTEQSISVSAIDRPYEFAINEDLLDTLEFSMGSFKTFTFTKSPSVKSLDFDLPAGWTAEEKGDGTFIITSPDLATGTGTTEGTIVVTPVLWNDQLNTSLAQTFNVFMNDKATFQFMDTEVCFRPGETKEVGLIAKGVKGIKGSEIASGWIFDFSDVKNGKISVTAPQTDGEFEGLGAMKLEASDPYGKPIFTEALNYRLYGINSLEDLLAFREGYGDISNTPNIEGQEKYMVDGALTLNKDITIPDDCMARTKAYFIKYLLLPFNGNGHTLTIDFHSILPVATIFQYAQNIKISNLKIAGTLVSESGSKNTYVAGLAARSTNVSYENIESDLDITFTATGSSGFDSFVGGITCTSDGPCSFTNCKVRGNITINNTIHYFGGMTSKTDASKPGSPNTFTDCEFGSNLTLNLTAANNVNTRFGGIAGDFARNGDLTRCSFTGKMTFNLNGFTFLTNNAGGVGGVLGRITAPASGYIMGETLTDCSASGSIIVNGVSGSEDTSRYGLIIGCIPNDAADAAKRETGTVITGSLSFN